MDGPYGEGFPPPGSANLPHILNMSVPTWTSLDDERRVAVLEQKLLEMDDEQAHRDKVASNMNTLHTKQLEKRLRILAAQTKQAQVRCSLHGVTLGLLLAILLPTATSHSLSSSPTPPTRFLGRALHLRNATTLWKLAFSTGLPTLHRQPAPHPPPRQRSGGRRARRPTPQERWTAFGAISMTMQLLPT